MAIEIKITAENPQELQQWAALFAKNVLSASEDISPKADTPSTPKQSKTTNKPAAKDEISPALAQVRKEAEAAFKKLGEAYMARCKAILKELNVKKLSEVKDEHLEQLQELLKAHLNEAESEAQTEVDQEEKSSESSILDEEEETAAIQVVHTSEELRKLAIDSTSGSPERKDALRKILAEAGVVGGVSKVPESKIDEVYEKIEAMANGEG